MNAEFFGLAILAGLNPKLLALDLLLIENRRPRAMFLWLLVAGLVVGVTIGLLDVLVFHIDAINQQRSIGAGVDLAVGLLLLVAGALVGTDRLHGRRKAAVPAPVGARPPEQERTGGKKQKESLAQRMLAEPRLTLAALAGAVIGIPGAAYLTALHHLVAGKYSTATDVIAVFAFVIISFFLIIIPFAFLELRPEPTKARLKTTQSWLLGHAQRLIVAVTLALGAYLTISALVRLS